ncbi:MAG: ChbG/HpnK family deacetylase [Bacteriovoracaceae bacterium]|nr:ChbG/HpnK family deacetylase [Bacteriovoracaceae bacterium]
MTERIKVFLNADDYGLNPYVNEGILDLSSLGLISGVSIMANYLDDESAKDLLKIDSIDKGLHFSLTTSHEDSSYPSLLFKYGLGIIDGNDLRTKLYHQFHRLIELGVELSFLDAHQNIQLLRKIFNPLEDFAKKHNLFLRVPYEISPFKNTKKLIYNSLAKRPNELPLIGLSMMGERLNPTNLKLQIKYLRERKINKVLWMVHPAKGGVQNGDSIGRGRLKEYKFIDNERNFISDHFEILSLKELVNFNL